MPWLGISQMIWLIMGLILFFGAHVQKRILTSLRLKLIGITGENGQRGIVALISSVGLVLIILGYKSSDTIYLYDLGPWGLFLNNIAMMFSVGFLGSGHSKSRFRRYFRHPMLTSVIFWSVSHLLANGDLKAVILFSGFTVWALMEIFLINRAAINFKSFMEGSLKGDIKFFIAIIIAYLVLSLIHLQLGVDPFF